MVVSSFHSCKYFMIYLACFLDLLVKKNCHNLLPSFLLSYFHSCMVLACFLYSLVSIILAIRISRCFTFLDFAFLVFASLHFVFLFFFCVFTYMYSCSLLACCVIRACFFPSFLYVRFITFILECIAAFS